MPQVEMQELHPCDVSGCNEQATHFTMSRIVGAKSEYLCDKHYAMKYGIDLAAPKPLQHEPIPLPHPLLNPESKHYHMVDDVEAITRMEQMYSVEDLMAWAKINAMKYRLRIGNKDASEKEVTKLLGYEAYYTYLKDGGLEN